MWVFIFVVLLASAGQGMKLKPKYKPLVVMDVDAGADDAMAIMLAISKRSTVKVKAITCVNGNTGLVNVTRNVLRTLIAADRHDIPVYAGSKDATVYTEPTDSFWGTDGFGDFDFPDPDPRDYISEVPAAMALVNMVKDNPNEIVLLATGPLTNIALAIHLYPTFLELLRGFVVLGGSYQGGGNVSPGVEFNMYADPEAANYVFSKATLQNPIRVVPLETVTAAALTMDFRLKQLGEAKNEIIEFLNKAERVGLSKSKDVWLAFDQMAASVVLQPSIVKQIEQRNVVVETSGKYSRGAWIVDNRPFAQQGPIDIITSVDKDQFQQLLLENLAF